MAVTLGVLVFFLISCYGYGFKDQWFSLITDRLVSFLEGCLHTCSILSVVL